MPTIINGHCWAAAVLNIATNTGFADIESVVVLFTRLVTNFMVKHWGQGSFISTLFPMCKGMTEGLSEEDAWSLVTGYGAEFKIETQQVTPEYGKLWTATLYERLMQRNLRPDEDITKHRYVYGTHVEIAVLAYILNMEVRQLTH